MYRPKMKVIFVVLFTLCYGVFAQYDGSGNGGNLRLCVVEGRGYRKAPRHCPVLEKENTAIECVVASDRMDCLRRMSKGVVDFTVVDAEDLVASQWANIDVLVTNQVKTTDQEFAAEVACVVSRSILAGDAERPEVLLRDRTLCHPGHGAMGISDTLSEYLESLVTERSCDPKLSLVENRIRSVGRFFRGACKPGPWLKDETRDAELKRLYPNLCSACNSGGCSKDDAYYGSQGALNCLTAGSGDVTWANVQNVRHRFGLNGERAQLDDPANYAFLCRDGSWLPLNTSTPCVWLNVPWPVVVAKRKAAESVRKLQESLTSDTTPVDGGWRAALLALLESRKPLPQPNQPLQAPQDYLGNARGFREAYSRSGCNPSRHITVCTASPLERNKCEWMSEAGAVYGVEPPLQCAVRQTKADCIEAVSKGEMDAVVAESDWLVKAQRDYALRPILFEKNNVVREMHVIVAYVMANSGIEKWSDLRDKKAAFPEYDGIAWHSVASTIESSTSGETLTSYLGDLCVLGTDDEDFDGEVENRLTKLCNAYEEMDQDEAVLKLLADGTVDVVFVSMDSLDKYTGLNGSQPWAAKLAKNDIKTICPFNETFCYFSWSSPGQVYISNRTEMMRRQEIINSFQQIDRLFGKNFPFDTAAFTMYGPFGNTSNVMFHDNMKGLSTLESLLTHPHNNYPRNFETEILPNAINRKYIGIGDISAANSKEFAIFMLVPLVINMLCYI